MANHALAALEAALRTRKLDRTLTSSLPEPALEAADATLATGLTAVDARLGGGLPRGHLSDIVGPASSGRTTVLLQLLAATTTRGELAALIDPFDRLDVPSAVEAGVDLSRLLWVRGDAPSRLDDERTIGRALKAINLVLQARGFACVVIDLADVPAAAFQRLPFTTWLRLQRIVEGSDTACVVLAPRPVARSAGGVTVSLAATMRWDGVEARHHQLTGAAVSVRVVSPRRRMQGELTVQAFAPGCAPAVDGAFITGETRLAVGE